MSLLLEKDPDKPASKMSGRPSSMSNAGESGGIAASSAFFGGEFANKAIAAATAATADNNGGEEKIFEEHVIIEYSGNVEDDEIASAYKVSLKVDDLYLYGPRKTAKPSPKYPPYNIILRFPALSPEVMYSLYRSDSESEATWIFHIYMKIFPDLIKASPEPLDKPAVERIIQLARQYEYYSGVHVAAAMDMVEQLKSPVLRGKMVKNGGKLLHSSLQVACFHGKFQAFRTIVEMDDASILEHLQGPMDVQGNCVLHLAAVCEDKRAGAQILNWFKQKILHTYNRGRRGGEEEDMPNGDEILSKLFKMHNAQGFASIHLACISQNLEAVEVLSSFVDNLEDMTCSQASLDSFSAVRNPLDIKSSTGHTPLHFVTAHPEILSHLLSLGADPNITDKNGLTPLHKAVLMGRLKSTLQLLAHKADPNCRCRSEKYKNVTPLHLAASLCDLESIKALRVFGGKIKGLKDKKRGATPLHIVESVLDGDPNLKREALSVLSAELVEANNEEWKELYRNITGNEMN